MNSVKTKKLWEEPFAEEGETRLIKMEKCGPSQEPSNTSREERPQNRETPPKREFLKDGTEERGLFRAGKASERGQRGGEPQGGSSIRQEEDFYGPLTRRRCDLINLETGSVGRGGKNQTAGGNLRGKNGVAWRNKRHQARFAKLRLTAGNLRLNRKKNMRGTHLQRVEKTSLRYENRKEGDGKDFLGGPSCEKPEKIWMLLRRGCRNLYWGKNE